jgi:hypothetical protein
VGVAADWPERESEMEKKEYHFYAVHRDVDVPRIQRENTDADFVRIGWKNETGAQAVYIATARGTERANAMFAGEEIYIGILPKVNPDGDVTYYSSDASDDIPYNVGAFRFAAANHGSDAAKNDAAFEKFYALLRERECKPIRMEVSAIR